MAAIKDAREAEQKVRSYYERNLLGPQPHEFEIHKQGDTWIVKFKLQGPLRNEERKWHIKAKDGRVTKK